MSGPDNKYQEMAREAAESVEERHEAGEQMTFLPDEAQPGDTAAATRGKGKALSQMRKWMADRGLRLPEDVLAEMAGMASSHDAFQTAMINAERVLAWAYDVNRDDMPPKTSLAPTPARRIEVFMQLFTIQLRAADAILPFGAPKATPDVNVNQQTTIIVPAGPSQGAPGDDARVVRPRAGARMAPPPLPGEIVENQDVTKPAPEGPDSESRTE